MAMLYVSLKLMYRTLKRVCADSSRNADQEDEPRKMNIPFAIKKRAACRNYRLG